ncbi:hypothetical protein HQ590_01365 [bacterium]|nr:hypothetical protein [bacterium]
MTRRERLTAIFRGDVPDRPAIKLWGAQPGQQLIHPDYQPVLDAALAKTDLLVESPRYLDWPALYWGAEPTPTTVERRPTESLEWIEEVTTVRTLGGPLRQVRRVSTVGRSGYFTERYLKEPADIETFLGVRYVLPPFDPEPHRALDRAVGDAGLPVCLLAHAPAALVQLIGSENFGLWLFDCRGELLRALRVLQQRMLQHLHQILGAGLRGVFGWGGPELLIPPLVAPETFDEFDAAFDQPLVDLIHDAGGTVWVHCHGGMRPMLRRFLEMQVDVLHPVEPPPSGDISLAEAFAVVGDRMGLDGNIQVHDFFSLEAPAIRGLVHETLAAGRGRRFILCPTSYYMEDPHPTRRYIENWLTYIEAARSVVAARGAG